MIKLTYRGPQSHMLITCPSRTNYTFDQANEYSLTPSSWADLYFILRLDDGFENRNFVFAEDPSVEKNDRRIASLQFEPNPDILLKQQENEARETKEKRFLALQEEYKRGIYSKISIGVLESIPETLEKDALAHAQSIVDKEPKEVPKATVNVKPVTPEVEVPQIDSTEKETPPEQPVTPDGEVVTPEAPKVEPKKKKGFSFFK